MNYLKVKQYGMDFDIVIEVEHYVHGNGLALQLYCVEGDYFEPYATLTVNLERYPTSGDRAFVDATDFPGAHDFIVKNKLGKPTGRIGMSGYCTYAEYEFDRNEIAKYELRPEPIGEKASHSKDNAR